MTFKLFFAVFLTIFFKSVAGFSATLKKEVVASLPPLPQYILSVDEVKQSVYETSAKSKMEESDKYKRKIAQTDTIDEKGFLSPSYIQVRNEFLLVKTVEQLEALVKKYDDVENLNKLDRDGQFLALQIASLKPYKSFFYRAKTYLGKNTAIRSVVVTNLKLAAKSQQVFNPTSEQKAIFDYMTVPMSQMGKTISTDQDLESYIVSELLPATVQNYNRYLKLLNMESKPIHWDNKVVFSYASFSDSADRFVQIGQPEQFLILAGLEQAVAGLLVTGAYSLEGFSDMIKRMGNEFGVDVVTPGIEGLSARKRFGILARFPSLFKLKPHGAGYTKAAYNFMKASYLNTKVAWKYIQDSQEDNRPQQITLWLNPQAFTPFTRQINTSLNNLDLLFSNSELSSAIVNGEKVNINLQKIFSEPPQSLSALYPTQFSSSDEYLEKNIDGKKHKYRNYLSDSAQSWSYAEYTKYLPSIKSEDKKNADVTKELRVLSQVWGANILGFSLAALVF